MPIDTSRITTPVSVISSESTEIKHSYKEYTEKFTEFYKNKLPRLLLLELAVVFASKDDDSYGSILILNRVLMWFCEYSIIWNISTINDIDTETVIGFMEYLKKISVGTDAWSGLFRSFRTSVRQFCPDILWPVLGNSELSSEGSTIAHPPYVFQEILKALRQEIIRIRAKKGNLKAILEKGKVITITELASLNKKGECKLTVEQLELLTADLKMKIPLAKLAVKYGMSRNGVDFLAKRIKNGAALRGYTADEPPSKLILLYFNRIVTLEKSGEYNQEIKFQEERPLRIG